MFNENTSYRSIFISYSKADKEFAEKLANDLRALGVDVWIDEAKINAGDSLIAEISKAIEKYEYFGVVLSPASIASEWVKKEIEFAMNRQIGDDRVLPLLREECSIPIYLRGISYVDFTRDEGYAKGRQRILQRLALDNVDQRLPDEISQLFPGEWVVDEAKEHGAFFGHIRMLHHLVQTHIEQIKKEAEVVITLYATSFPVTGVGKFEYDLIYYRNIRDSTPMFGPLVRNDDRRTFAESGETREIGSPSGPIKRGGFIDREEIKSFAKFKLFGVDEKQQKEIAGLLFINGRRITDLPESIFDDPQFATTFSNLEASVDQVRKTRRLESAKKIAYVIGNLPPSIQVPISPSTIDSFFRGVLDKLKFFTRYDDLIFSAYLYSEKEDSNRRRLTWLWSNSPTSTPVSVPLPRTKTKDSLLIADVAIDPNNKPLLVHDVRNKESYKGKVTRTHLGDDSHVDLAVPVLSDGSSRLLGVLDIQTRDPQRFDTDDVQVMYMLSEFCLSGALERVQEVPDKNHLPLHNTTRYMPIKKRGLEFSVNDMLDLNFNPMKFLLHWKKIKELIRTNETQAPASVEVWPNMVCNHRCAWCRTERHRKLQRTKKKEMTPEELRGIAEDIQRLGPVDILISGGGEPLLHASIHEFIDLIADAEGTIGIFTNGTRPKDFRFWERFFRRTDRHRFVRVSFNGHDPESYFRIHFDSEDVPDLPSDHRTDYAEARKIVMDLLGLRSSRASVAIGDTVQFNEIKYVEDKAKHAKDLGVDFIQMRPELLDSSQHNDRGKAVCDAVRSIIPKYASKEENFSVVHTDGERSFVPHDEPRCYAMHLVPTLVPDEEEGWTRVMPCSYAINTWGKVPDLGRMREGAKLSEFWKQMNQKLQGADPQDPEYEVTIEQHIDPRNHCPQCRYFRLNKRIQSLVDNEDKLILIDRLVDSLLENPEDLDDELCEQINKIWGNGTEEEPGTIDIELAKKAFQKSQQIEITPSF